MNEVLRLCITLELQECGQCWWWSVTVTAETRVHTYLLGHRIQCEGLQNYLISASWLAAVDFWNIYMTLSVSHQRMKLWPEAAHVKNLFNVVLLVSSRWSCHTAQTYSSDEMPLNCAVWMWVWYGGFWVQTVFTCAPLSPCLLFIAWTEFLERGQACSQEEAVTAGFSAHPPAWSPQTDTLLPLDVVEWLLKWTSLFEWYRGLSFNVMVETYAFDT